MPFFGVLINDRELFGRFKNFKTSYTLNLFLPLALLAFMILLPFLVLILSLKPCVLFLGVLCG